MRLVLRGVIGTLQVLKRPLSARSQGSQITIVTWKSVCVRLYVCVFTQYTHTKSVRLLDSNFSINLNFALLDILLRPPCSTIYKSARICLAHTNRTYFSYN